MREVPDYITHYYEEASDMLKNICSHPDEVAEAMLTHLKETGKRTWLHPGYLEERRRVEAWLYDELVPAQNNHKFWNQRINFSYGIETCFYIRYSVTL